MFLLLALVLLIVLPSPWGFVGFGIGLVCFGGEVVYWQRKSVDGVPLSARTP